MSATTSTAVALGKHFHQDPGKFFGEKVAAIDFYLVGLIERFLNPGVELGFGGCEAPDEEKAANRQGRINSILRAVDVRNELGGTELKITAQMLSLIGIYKRDREEKAGRVSPYQM